MIPTARNYAAQAERGLLNSTYDKLTTDVAKAYASVIRNCVHFALPDNGLIFNDQWKGLEGCQLNLPYDGVTIEYYVAPEDNHLISEKSEITTKRVLIAWKENESICLAAVVYLQSMNKWFPNLGYVKIDSNQAIAPVTPTSTFEYEFRNFKGISENDKISCEENIKLVIPVLMEFLEALTCRNVYTESLEPVDERKNEKRVKNGKLPIYETKILVVDSKPKEIDKTWKGGTHASPKQHLRRGHIRRYSWGNIWINNMIVGKAENGVVRKSYEVK